jgi:hypothetical protein
MHTYISELADFSPTNILAQWIRADGTLVRLLVVLVFIITHVDGICHKKGWSFTKISIQSKYVQRFTSFHLLFKSPQFHSAYSQYICQVSAYSEKAAKKSKKIFILESHSKNGVSLKSWT